MKILKSVIVLAIYIIGFQAIVAQDPHAESGLTKGIVQEVLQVSSYTYLNVLEDDGSRKWLAVPLMDANLGEIYYYKGGMEMPDFTSTELKRTFDSVTFLSSITNANIIDAETGTLDSSKIIKKAKQPTLEKLELFIDEIDGGIRIEELLKNKTLYARKKIKVKGEVTKFSSGIMKRNWVHFQDGTEFEGLYDLMVTTQENVNVGDVGIFEGVITLDKDFGAGYFYKVIMEDAVLVK